MWFFVVFFFPYYISPAVLTTHLSSVDCGRLQKETIKMFSAYRGDKNWSIGGKRRSDIFPALHEPVGVIVNKARGS